MGRREWPLRFECKHPGCQESATFRYQSRRDLVGSFEAKRYREGWLCTRHRNVDQVLSRENPETTFTVECQQHSYGRFFGNAGIVSGLGFVAFAKDFPPGTKLTVVARVELPDEKPVDDYLP